MLKMRNSFKIEDRLKMTASWSLWISWNSLIIDSFIYRASEICIMEGLASPEMEIAEGGVILDNRA